MLWNDPFAPPISQLTRTAAFLPAADVAVSDEELTLTMDLPGLTADDVSIELLDGHVIVRGERARPDLGDGASWAHTERAFGRFERRITVPDRVDPERISASMDNGVLSLVVPKPEPRKPRTIAIGSETEQRELETAAA